MNTARTNNRLDHLGLRRTSRGAGLPKPVAFIAMLIGSLAIVCETASAQVVQLPSIQTFSYTGSVLVPDRGTASLGGISRSGSFSNRQGFGPFTRGGNSGFASRSNLSASATIIDLDEMDRQIRGIGNENLATNSGPITREDARSTIKPKPAAMIQEGKTLVRYARAKYASGDHEMAKVGYQMAIAKLDGHLLEYALREYRSRF